MKNLLLLLGLSLFFYTCQQATSKEADTEQTPSQQEEPVVLTAAQKYTKGYVLNNLLDFDSEAALKEVFGDDIQRSTGYYPEGLGEYTTTTLFGGTDNEVVFKWSDDTLNFNQLETITINKANSAWQTKDSIRIGTKLKTLELINQKPFTFLGFGWDYAGAVQWQSGTLETSNTSVRLDLAQGSSPSDFLELLGDTQVSSDTELAQKANPVVVEIFLTRVE